MGTIQDKQTYNLTNYIKRLQERKEVLEDRKDYILEMAMKNSEKKKGTTSSSDSGSGTGGEEVSGGSVVLNGSMPSTDQYTGPDSYYDAIIGENYQSGLKAKLAGTDQWNKDIFEQAQKAGVNPLIVKVVMATESGGKHSSTPNAYNCVGLMQVQDSLVADMGLDWSKAKSDPVYNIYCGCKALVNKHNYAKNVIKGAGNLYTKFKAQGYELKPNCHGTAWLYNGFSVPSGGSSKVTTGGYIYANQVAAMYAGFGRDAHVDSVLTLDVLGDKKSETEKKKEDKTKERQQELLDNVGARSFALAAVSEGIADKGIVREPMSEDESLFYARQQMAYNVPTGKVKGRYYYPPSYLRSRYAEDRKTSGPFRMKTDFAPLPQIDFQHLGGPQENFYAKEAREVFKLLKSRLKYRQLVVTRGFDPNADSNNSSHAVGIAMDIYAATPEEAIRIADAAWLLGIRAIAIGPKFVHIDTGPEAVWGYDEMAVYRGPGTIKPRGITYGFK